jgi:hypothetical protein
MTEEPMAHLSRTAIPPRTTSPKLHITIFGVGVGENQSEWSGEMAVEMSGGLGDGDKVRDIGEDIGVKHRVGIRDQSRKS